METCTESKNFLLSQSGHVVKRKPALLRIEKTPGIVSVYTEGFGTVFSCNIYDGIILNCGEIVEIERFTKVHSVTELAKLTRYPSSDDSRCLVGTSNVRVIENGMVVYIIELEGNVCIPGNTHPVAETRTHS